MTYVRGKLIYDAIVNAIANATEEARSIEQSSIGLPLVDHAEVFYFNFDFLVILTEHRPEFQIKIEVIQKANSWLDQMMSINDLKKLKSECVTGIELFREYKRALEDAGIIENNRTIQFPWRSEPTFTLPWRRQ